MHILLIRFSSLGDIVLQSGFVSFLRFAHPQSKISFLTDETFKSLVQGHRDIDKVHLFKKEKGPSHLWALSKLIQTIHADHKVDMVIDLHGSTRSSLLKLLSWNLPWLSIDKRKFERHFLVHCGLKTMNSVPSIHSRNTLDFLGALSRNRSLGDFTSWLQETYQRKLRFSSPPNQLPNECEKLIVIAPVASFKNKRWSIEYFKELIKMFLAYPKYDDYRLVCLAGPNDDYCQVLNDIQSTRFENLQGKTSLEQTIELISRAALVIGNDSGLGHVAEAYGVNVLAIFGPTHETLGFAPHLEGSQSISIPMWCRPCSATGKTKCFRQRQYCLENITPQDVLDRVESMNVL